MSKTKQQKIIVFVLFNENDKNLILNGIRIASIFKKELCLCYNYSKKEKKNKESIREKLTAYTVPIKNDVKGLTVSTLLSAENMTYLPEKLADDYEAIVLLADSNNFKKYRNAIAESPVPFLFVNGKEEKVPDFKKVILPIDFRKENQDSMLWASYFSRFNSSGIIVVAANDKEKDSVRQVKVNLALCRRLFQKFRVEHKIFRGQKSSYNNTNEALELALSSQSELLIMLGSSAITPIDLLIGLPEKKIVKKAAKLPVLIINPQKDNYILCD